MLYKMKKKSRMKLGEVLGVRGELYSTLLVYSNIKIK